MVKNMLKKIFLQGQIPYLPRIKPVLYWAAWLAPFSIFLMPSEHGEFAEIGWMTLVAVMAIRPLADTLPDLRILRTLTSLRREFGIFAGMMLIAHFAGWMIDRGVSIFNIFSQSFYWSFDGIFLWGLLGVFLAIIVLMTSNVFAMKLLKRKWKTVQSLSYLLLIFGGIHIMLVGEESGLAGLLIVGILWILAKLKIQIKTPKTLKSPTN
jgi:DMSO/TMAO reductase YedYZ heme-binding membrane subunit